jgi:hypothetical protein
MQGSTCIFWADLTPFSLQLLEVDWTGAYWGPYCPDIGCVWDATDGTADAMTQIQRLCEGCAARTRPSHGRVCH